MPPHTTREQQLEAARGEDPMCLLAWEKDGVAIYEEAWIEAIAHRPCLYVLVPHRLKTLAMSHKAMEQDALLFAKVPECHRTDAYEEAYAQARKEKDAAHMAAEEEEGASTTSSSEDDVPLQRRAAALAQEKRTVAAHPAPPEKEEAEARPPRRFGPLGGYKACLGDARTAAAEPHKGEDSAGIDLTVLEALKGAGQRFGKIFMVANDPGATESERIRAQELVDKKLREGKHEVLEAYKTLTEGGAARPGLQKVEVWQHAAPATRQQHWMSVLGSGVATQFLVKCCKYARPLRFGFYGDGKGAVAAATLYVELFTFVCDAASNHSWAQGFADRYNAIQKDLMRTASRAAQPGSSSALVLVDKRALIATARTALGMNRVKRASKLKGSHGDAAAYAAGQAAASVQVHAPSKKARLA